MQTSTFINKNGSEQLSQSLINLSPSDLIMALLPIAAHYGLDRTEAAISHTFLKSDSEKIMQAMNATLKYICA